MAYPDPALVEILHKVGYRKFMFVKVTVWKVAVCKSSCLEKLLFGKVAVWKSHSLEIHKLAMEWP